MESQRLTQYKIVFFIYFSRLTFFSFTFYKKIDETCQFFHCKKAYNVKRQDFFQKIILCCAFYGLDTESEPEPLLVKSRDSEPEP
jgi:hypothetical protein